LQQQDIISQRLSGMQRDMQTGMKEMQQLLLTRIDDWMAGKASSPRSTTGATTTGSRRALHDDPSPDDEGRALRLPSR
jgi:hypothetical protein